MKAVQAVQQAGIRRITIAGGVAANSRLRSMLAQLSTQHDFDIFYPDFQYCTDNGAMIAFAGMHQLRAKQIDDLNIIARPRLSISSI
jgi:N6-L-threonylcarbamoyladenine synthase